MQTVQELATELVNEKLKKNQLVEKVAELEKEIERLKTVNQQQD